MHKKKNKVLSIALAMAMFFCMMPTGFEVHADDKGIFIEMDSGDKSGNGWTYTAVDHTLKLNGYSGEFIEYDDDERLTIELEGTNTITIPESGEDEVRGIFCNNDLTIKDAGSGNGKLRIKTVNGENKSVYGIDVCDFACDSGTMDIAISSKEGTYGIYACNININAGKLDIKVKTDMEGMALFAHAGAVEIASGAKVNVELHDEKQQSFVIGIKAYPGSKNVLNGGDINIKGDVSITGRKGSPCGFLSGYRNGSIDMTEGIISITGGKIVLKNLTSGIRANPSPDFSEARSVVIKNCEIAMENIEQTGINDVVGGGVLIEDAKIHISGEAIGILVGISKGLISIKGKSDVSLISDVDAAIYVNGGLSPDSAKDNEICLAPGGKFFAKTKEPTEEAIQAFFSVDGSNILKKGSYSGELVNINGTPAFEKNANGEVEIGVREIIDVTGVYWDVSESPFTYDRSEKSVKLKGVPAGVTATVTNNVNTIVGDYEATATLTPANPEVYLSGSRTVKESWQIIKGDISGNDFTMFVPAGKDKTLVTPAGFGIDEPGKFVSDGAVIDPNGVLNGAPKYEEIVSCDINIGAAAGSTVTIPLKYIPDDANFNEKKVVLTLKVTAKKPLLLTAHHITDTYSGNPVDVAKAKLKATFEGNPVEGTYDWKAGSEVTNVVDSGTKAIVFTPANAAEYEETEVNIILTINKAECTGEPGFTKIHEAGKTLANVILTQGTLSPVGGTIEWDLPETTLIEQEKEYEWKYTLDENYAIKRGKIKLWSAGGSGGNTGGGGSGGGDAGGAAPTYAVTVEKAENGSVTSSHGSAVEGTTVVLTVTPDKGFLLAKLTVQDAMGNEIATTQNGDKYSFKMPGGKVSVKAAFETDNIVMALSKFTDVKDSDYFAKAVAWAVSKGITTGTSPTAFSPNAPCTRAQIVTFLWRAAGKPEPQKTDNPFADVKADAYYNKALLWAVEQGIVNGTSATSFSPNATCTRGQMAAILYRYAKSPEVKGGKTFADVKEGAYYANAVKWAAEQGITSGTSATSFSPDATCTRAQIVTFLYRYIVK